jgi:hypothetical protein
MKCRACWADKAYIREIKGWRGSAMSWLGVVPLKCHHCYHKFSVPWFLTIGKQLTPPVLRGTVPRSVTPKPAHATGAVKLTSAGDSSGATASASRKAA